MPSLLAKTRGWKLPLVAAAGLTFALVSVLSRDSAPAKEPVITPPVSQYANSVAGIGVVEPSSEVISIGTELPGVVRNVHVRVGDKVTAGTPLFTLDERDINAHIAMLEASLEAASVQVEDTAAQYATVRDISDKRAVARDDYNRRKFAHQLAIARKEEMETQLQQTKTTKERLTVTAPVNGEVLSVNIRPGEYASAGALPEPLMRMGSTDTLHVRVEIDEENATHITQDAPAQGFRRGDTQHAIPLTFVRFEPYVRPKQNLAVSGQRVDTRVLQVIYALAPQNKTTRIFTGQQLDVFISTEKDTQP